MEPIMIYILDEKIPYAQLKTQIEVTQPLTKEQVVDLIISKIDGQDVIILKEFKRKFEASSFQFDTNENKRKIYLEALKNLEIAINLYGKCDDPQKLRATLLNTDFSYYIEHDKTILYNRQIQDWTNIAAGWMVLGEEIDYLLSALKALTSTDSNSSPHQKDIPEKWYALLHSILLKNGKVDPFENNSDKEYIMQYGKSKYKFKQTGQGFYKELSNIRESSIEVYIKSMLPKDRPVWKNIIKEISGNDADVILWLKKQPK